jgi:hypothetical protein
MRLWSNFLVRALQLLLRPPMQNFAALRIHFMAQLHRCHFKSLNFNLPSLSLSSNKIFISPEVLKMFNLFAQMKK